MPKYLIIVLQVLVIIVGLLWFVQLAGYLPKMASRCPSAANLPYVTFAAMVFIIIIAAILYKAKSLGRYLAWTAVVSVIVTSQHFATASNIGNGSYNIEFQRLVDWYLANTQPGDKMASTWSSLLKLMADKHEKNIVPMNSIKGKSWEEFVGNCRKRKVDYISWTHRGSGRKTRRGMDHIGPVLVHYRDNPDFLFVHRIEIPSRKKNRWINIFKLRQPPPDQALPATR